MPTTAFQRRLTKMYTDTKNIYDFVKEPVKNEEDPELQSLHRKLRIQQNRLVSWGLEWSDPTQSPDIDESISQAGLSELVGSVMTTIKEILAEAEPLWQSSKRLPDERPSEKTGDKKIPLIQWDKSRFEDLMRDLTMSIDTLFDLSKTRQSTRGKGLSAKASEASTSRQKLPLVEERQFESTRMSAPQQIDPATLIWPKDLMFSSYGRTKTANESRQIVFMRRPVTSSDLRAAIGQPPPPVPILLEYAPYDPIYSITGITPSMTRFEKLFAGLSQAYFSNDKLLVGLLRLIGYYEDAENSRFCLLFALPTNFGPMDIESPSMQMPTVNTLSDLLISPAYEPSLEVKYRLAYNLANAVFDLHAKGIVHGNLLSSNVLFIEHPTSRQPVDLTQINMRHSYLGSYDLFSDNATDGSDSGLAKSSLLYRHSLDPRITSYTNLTAESKSLDLYSLAMILLEIGLWSSLSELFPRATTVPSNPADVLKHLASRCGSIYVKAVQACWRAPEAELSRQARPDVMHQKVFWSVSKALDACCAIDEVSDSDDNSEGDNEAPMVEATPLKVEIPAPYRREPKIELSAGQEPEVSWLERPAQREPSPEKIITNWSEKPSYAVQTKPPKPKLKTFPAIRISQEHLNFWHTNIMPHINHVLRGFYKKYPESVEISLESVGETSAQTKPTILVICTSVNKVRSILKKSLVYDKAIFGLKVCRGKVVRSRKDGVKRSMAHGDGTEAKNIEHQERPQNGASIGAFINDHHLPPVSLGGVITIDDKPYGMSVHHMLDDPSDDEEPSPPPQPRPSEPILRSSARPQYLEMPDLSHSDTSYYSSGEEEYMYTLSDYSSSSSFSDSNESAYPSEDEDDSDAEFPTLEPGDIPPIPPSPSNLHRYPLTQPAMDDIDPEFYPDPETRDEDHLDSFMLGSIYTTSGIKRMTHENLTHEIDWALFSFLPEREPHPSSSPTSPSSSASISGIVPLTDLPDLPVKCTARTSGTQTGRILPAMSSLKIYGRKTPSVSWQVAGRIGVPGDSGAWVVEREGGRVAGSVLAWSERKCVGYICPMWVTVLDIADMVKPAKGIGLLGQRGLVWCKGVEKGSSNRKEQLEVRDWARVGGEFDDDDFDVGRAASDTLSLTGDDIEERIDRIVGFKADDVALSSDEADDEEEYGYTGFGYRYDEDEDEVEDQEEEPVLVATLNDATKRGKRFGVRSFSGENSMDGNMGVVEGLKELRIDGGVVHGAGPGADKGGRDRTSGSGRASVGSRRSFGSAGSMGTGAGTRVSVRSSA
ncbi:het-s domain-containing protein [Rutstroemia sp. NJR-2017a BBW]|nr:het-s domain-containing protein [Rutstroemia sp. NJR-2017a BBW]